MSASLYRGHWLVYLNGIEVPCPSVTVNIGIGNIPSATLNFPPHRLLQRLGAEDRLDVAAFYLDHFAGKEGDATFRLLFDGEIVGWSYRSTAFGRMMSFNALMDIDAYNQLQYYFMNTAETIVADALNPATATGAIVQAGAVYPYSLFQYGLIYEPGAVPKETPVSIRKPYDLLMNVVRGMVSKKIPNYQRTRAAVNFFARWAKKRNFMNRFVAVPLLEDATTSDGVFPIFKAAQSVKAVDQVKQSMATSVGSQGSLFDVLRTVLGVVEYEFAMLPTAPAAWVRRDTGAVVANTDKFQSREEAQNIDLRLLNYHAKPEMLFAIPPRFNIVFPSMLTGYAYEENYREQATRLYTNDQMYTGLWNDTSGITTAALTYGYPPEADAAMRRIKTVNGAPAGGGVNQVTTGRDVVVFPEEFYKGPVVASYGVPPWYNMLAAQAVGSRGSAAENQTYLDSLRHLGDLYARYSYFKSRYSKRGGSVDMSWNPYLVPGYPCVIFDHRASAYDTVGYVMNVSHTMDAASNGTMRTVMNYGYGRTLQEVMEQIPFEVKQFKAQLGSAPAEPISVVRDVVQNKEKANAMYLKLFYHDNAPSAQTAQCIFNVPDAVEVEGDAKAVTNVYNAATSGKPATYYDGLSKAVSVSADKKLVPTAAYAPLFTDNNQAMRYVARPICTLTEYIRFLHGGVVPPEIQAKRTSFEGTGAYYYPKIRVYHDGPAVRPVDKIIGASLAEGSDGYTATVVEGYSDAVQTTFPETRDNWSERIEKYRDEIKGNIPLR